jgi:RIO-like serine/threonine protein kinase
VIILRKENLSSYEIQDAIRESSVKCEFVVNEELHNGRVHLYLPYYNFIVSDGYTQISYVVDFRQIISITTED